MEENSKRYDLEERTAVFAENCRQFVRKLPRTVTNFEDIKQLTRSSGSIAANYIEVNESLSKKDFVHRIRICKKESKETRLWLRLINTQNNLELNQEREKYLQEATELMKIFGSIIEKSI